MEISRGTTRDRILRTLLKRHQQEGITDLGDRLHHRVETLIEQELCCLGEIYAAYIDFKTGSNLENYQSSERFNIVCELLQRALLELEIDVKERFLLLLKLLYPQEKIQAAAFNLRSKLGVNLAQGLEILEHTVNLQSKSVLLNILDKRSPQEKLQKLVEKGMVEYQPMAVSDRTRNLVAQRDLLSDWAIACCFHFAQVAPIRLFSEQILATLRHPTGFVREAAIAYLSSVSPSTLLKLLPQLQNDPHPLVANLVKEPTMLTSVDRLLFLRQVPIFKELRDDFIVRLASVMDELSIPAHYTIFQAGDEGRSLYIVISGRVKIHIGNQELAVFPKGQSFGEMAVFDAQPRSASATTLEPCECLELTQEQLYEAIEETPEIAVNIIGVLSRRIRELNDKINALHPQQ